MCSGYGRQTDSAWAIAEVPSVQLLASNEDRIGLPGLPGKRAKTSLDTISFVPGRDRDNSGAVGLIHR